MQVSSLHCSSNLDEIPLSRKPIATEDILLSLPDSFASLSPVQRLQTFPHFGSVVQPSKSRLGPDFRPGLSGLYPVCSRKPLRMEIIQHLWANCSTACLSSWWKSLSRYLTWSSGNLIQPPSSLHSPSLPSFFLYWFICLSCWSLSPVTCGIFSAVNIFNQLDQSIIIVQHLKPRKSWMGMEMPISLMRCK